MVLVSLPASLRIHRIKDTTLKTSKTATGEQETKAGPLHPGSCRAPGCVPVKLARLMSHGLLTSVSHHETKALIAPSSQVILRFITDTTAHLEPVSSTPSTTG